MPAIAQSRSCKFCGESGLYWQKIGVSVRLVSPTYGIHRCDRYRRQQTQPMQTPVQIFNPVIEPAIEPAKRVWSGQHEMFPRLLSRLQCKQNVMLVGPAGTGKTHASHEAAKSLDLPFYPISVGPQTSKSDLLGYMGTTGQYVWTVLAQAYRTGGVFLLDEMDAGNAGVLTILNALLANDVCSFPDGVASKHPDFRCIAAANTYGHGADRQYVGRNQMDAATLDRFIGLDWNYDELMEEHLSSSQPDWCLKVWALRRANAKIGTRYVFGTRKILNGTKMLDAGISQYEVEQETIWFGVKPDDKAKLLQNI